jgi:hypothetical protein
MDELGRLMRLCPPPRTPARAIRGISDGGRWEIPGDYAELLGAYGPGSFDEFCVIAKNATTILSELMHGSLRIDFMPDDFPIAGAGFTRDRVI